MNQSDSLTAKIRISALIIGGFVVFGLDGFSIPEGLQATIFTMLVVGTLLYLIEYRRSCPISGKAVATREEVPNSPGEGELTTNVVKSLKTRGNLPFLSDRVAEVVLGGASLGFAMIFAVYTNSLIISIATLSTFLAVTLLYARYLYGTYPSAGLHYVAETLRLFGASFLNLFDGRTISSFFPVRIFPLRMIERKYVVAIVIGMPLLVLFHLLFTNINSEYELFTRQLLRIVWRVLSYLINVEFLWDLVRLALWSYVVHAGLTVRSERCDQASHPWGLRESVHLVLGALIFLFLVFSFFQSKLLITPAASLSFRELSLYTQRGFWELLVASVIGYVVLLFFIRERPLQNSEKAWRVLLLCFVAELIGLAIFSLHKLAILQHHFGLKDQRIFATLAVLLIGGTFVCAALRILGRITEQRIFILQIGALFVSTLILGAVNVETLATRIHPIRYYVDGTPFKDMSYLLGNSYDNVSEWPALMEEAKRRGLPNPEHYYWGRYSPICSYNEQRKQSSTHLQRHFYSLSRRYGSELSNEPLSEVLRFKWHEFQAYRFVKTHSAEVFDFLNFVMNSCGPKPSPSSLSRPEFGVEGR